jgi:hypothetical protein
MKNLIVVMGAMALSGCSSWFAPKVGCSEESTKNLVFGIFRDSVGEFLKANKFGGDTEVLLASLQLSLKSIRTESHDEKLNKYVCKAELHVQIPENVKQSIDSKPAIQAALKKNDLKIVNDSLEASVTYNSQSTDNKEQQFVEASGHRALSQFVTGLVIGGALGPKVDAAPQPAATPVGAFREPAEIEGDSVSTRFGTFSVSPENLLLFNGQALNPQVEGNNSLSFVEIQQVGEKDVLLVRDNGGTACPSLFYYVAAGASGATATPSFGTCAELRGTARQGDTLLLTMSGFLGPFEDEKMREAAFRETHTFAYSNGAVTENGKPAK